MSWGAIATVALAAALASGGGTALLRRALARRAILDRPNERSSHSVPTPRGAGIAVVGALLAGWLALALLAPGPGLWIALILLLAALLSAFSWIDDLRGLSIAPRLAVQAAAVAAGILGFGDDALIFQGVLPLALDRLAAGLAWLWFVNLYNFMDGIDGITGVETAAIALGVFLLGGVIGTAPQIGAFGAVAAAAALGFLFWNWHPAKIFLGDVGSVPLGFLMGWLLLVLAASGQWAPALILPAYYLGDATLTLARRALRGEAVWRPHREHAYQRAVRAGRRHDETVIAVAIVDLGLIGLAALAVLVSPLAGPALGGGAVLVGALLWYLPRPRIRPEDG